MPIEFKLFSDAIEGLKKLGELALGIKGVPAKKRRRLVEAVSEAYMLLNSSVNLVHHRLNHALLIDKDKDFVNDVRTMSHYQAWHDVERDMRMCKSLRHTHVEIDHLSMTAPDLLLGGRDWNNIRTLVDEILEREGELACYISRALQRFSTSADACKSAEDVKKLRTSVKRAANKLAKDRVKLIKEEISFTDAVV